MFGLASMAAACGAAGWMNYSASKAIGKPHQEDVKIPTTPAEALQVLIEGNRRFADGKSMASHRDIGRVRQVAKEQKPFAAFLGLKSFLIKASATSSSLALPATWPPARI
jgi:hypothetical protein